MPASAMAKLTPWVPDVGMQQKREGVFPLATLSPLAASGREIVLSPKGSKEALPAHPGASSPSGSITV